MGYHLQNQKSQKISPPLQDYLQRLKDMDVCYTALVVAFYLLMDRIKEVGDPWTLNGDLADFIGDFIGGFGNVDIPI